MLGAIASRPSMPPTVAFERPAIEHLAPGPMAGDWPARVRAHLEEARVPLSDAEIVELLAIVERCSERFALDPLAVLAVIQVESGFDRTAVSSKGAMGLMQLRLETAQEVAEALGVEWTSDEMVFDPETNVLLGTCYLRYLLDRFEDPDAAFAAFNAGPSRIEVRRIAARPIPLRYPDRVWRALSDLQARAAA